MSIFAITFRIEYDSTYNDRYASVVAAVKSETTTKYWQEPTSFLLIESEKSSADLAANIDRKSSFSSSKDLLLVVNLSKNAYKALGKVADSDLDWLMSRR